MSLSLPSTFTINEDLEPWLGRWPATRSSLHAMTFAASRDPKAARLAEKATAPELARRLWHDFGRSDCVFDPSFASRTHTRRMGQGLAVEWALGWKAGMQPSRVHGIGLDVESTSRETPDGLFRRIRAPGEIDHGLPTIQAWTIKEAMLKADRGAVNPFVGQYRIHHFDRNEWAGTGLGPDPARVFHFRVIEDMGWTLAFCVSENR